MKDVTLAIADPGHFHAALIQKHMYPGVSPRVAVYAPLGPDLIDYLGRVARFNLRAEDPTRWALDVHAEPEAFDRLLAEPPGRVVVFSGRNRGKIDRIVQSLEAGHHVLADKPWIITPADLPKLESALALAEPRGLVAYDIMTERFEITSMLQRELVGDEALFGALESGAPDAPAVTATSVHHLMKTVAGVPLRRPAWFFDIREVGEALADVGTHVVDLVQETAFPDRATDYRRDLEVLAGRRWPTTISRAQFQAVTGEADFPAALGEWIQDGVLSYFCNNRVEYRNRGAHVRLDILWNWDAPAGAGDLFEIVFRGTRARVEIRQGPAEHFVPELYVVPNRADRAADVFGALERRVAALQATWPGVACVTLGGEARLEIPQVYRVGHEAHFAQVASRFFEYLNAPASLPAWERPNMVAKYFVSTRGVELGRCESSR